MLNVRRNIGKKWLAVAFAAFAGVLFLLPPYAASASANSAPAYWAGSDGMGVVATDGDCPIEVTKEALTFDIATLPEKQYETAEQFAAYRASVTAEYTFHNPTQEALSVGLAFPFGAFPEYLTAYDGEAEKFVALDDSDRYSVTVDGAAAETQLRYTYYRENYGGEDALALPADTKAERGVFREDAPVYAFSYTADTQGAKGDYVLEVRLSYNPAHTRILRESYRDYELEDGDLFLFLYLNGSPARFFAVGEKPQVKSVKVAKDENLYSGERTYLDAAVMAAETVGTFGAWVEESRPQRVGETDWYNAVLAYLGEVENTAWGFVHGVPSYVSETWLMRWFTYSITIPQGGSVVNRVTAPIYPDISGSSFYQFRYLLSPAQGWASFGTFSLRIRTDFPVSRCSLDIREGKGEYTYEREGLPIGDLAFEIWPSGAPHDDGLDLNTISLIILGVGFGAQLIAGGIILIVFCVKKKRARARRGENPRPTGG